jgi:hypothetical protein
MTYRPVLTYIADYPAAELTDHLNDIAIAHLVVEQRRLCLAIRDLSAVRAEHVRALNRAQVPVVAWLTRDETESQRFYRFSDGDAVVARYQEFQAWSIQNGLRWAALGLEIEPDLHDAVHFDGEPHIDTNALIRRVADHWHIESATAQFQALFAQMRADGHTIELYELPFVRDDRVSGSTLARRLLGLPNVSADQSVVRLYSSMTRPYGSGLIANYAPEFSAVAIGDLHADGLHQPLAITELMRDLAHVAACRVPHIYIAGLSVTQMPEVATQVARGEWLRAVAPPLDDNQQRVSRMRAGLRALLWAGARPAVLLPLLIPVLLLIRRMLRAPHPHAS